MKYAKDETLSPLKIHPSEGPSVIIIKLLDTAGRSQSLRLAGIANLDVNRPKGRNRAHSCGPWKRFRGMPGTI